MRKGQRKGELLDPIVRWERDGDDQVLLMDTRAMTIHLSCDDRTVRRYEPVACDVRTRAPLWDALAVGAARQGIRTRTPRAGRRTSGGSVDDGRRLVAGVGVPRLA